MAGKIRHLINRSGRYHACLVVPKDLREEIGKTELRLPLGADYRQALKMLPSAVAQLQNQIGDAERKSGQGSVSLRYPLAPDQLALSLYQQRLELDEKLRNYPSYASNSVDDLLAKRLRDAIAGLADDQELEELVGSQLEIFRKAGNVDAMVGSHEWRVIARASCSAEYEALERVYERDEGDFSGTHTAPILVNAQPPEKPQERVSLSGLWKDYVLIRQQAGFMRDGGKRQSVAFDSLRKFLRHDDAHKATKKDFLTWRDELIKTLAAKTVSDVYLSTIRSLFGWAVENDRLPENATSNVRLNSP